MIIGQWIEYAHTCHDDNKIGQILDKFLSIPALGKVPRDMYLVVDEKGNVDKVDPLNVKKIIETNYGNGTP